MMHYSIKDIERISGIKAHTLRIWEQRYNILLPHRTETNIRTYNDDDLRKILNVALLNHHGLKISRIAEMSAAEMKTMISTIISKPVDYEQYIQALILAMVNLDQSLFEKTIASALEKNDLLHVMVNICYPFLERIGVMWIVGTINPAQEHFISYLIRQKLIVAIDKLGYEADPAKPTYLLFLHQHELHEIGLLVYHYLIRQSGANVIYLGTSVPFDDLIQVNKICKPKYVVTLFTNAIEQAELERYLHQLSELFQHQVILTGGIQMPSYTGPLPSNVKVLDHVHELVDFLEK